MLTNPHARDEKVGRDENVRRAEERGAAQPMSEVDQRSGVNRLRRLLTRALTIAGTTVAGASVAWAVGAGVAVAAEDGAAGDSSRGPAGAGSEQLVVPSAGAGPDESRVGGPHDTGPSLLDSVAGVAAPEGTDSTVAPTSTPDAGPASGVPDPGAGELTAGVVHRVTGAVGTLAHRAGTALEPVARVGDVVLPGDGDRGVIDTLDPDTLDPDTLPIDEVPIGGVELPIGGVDAPTGELPGPPGAAPDHRGSLDPLAPRLPDLPVVPAPQQPSEAVAGTTTVPTVSAVAVDGSVAARSPADRAAPGPGPALPPAVPAPVSFPCGTDGYLATGHGSHSGAGIVGHSTDRARLGRTHVHPAHTTARALAGESRPQPGVTPD